LVPLSVRRPSRNMLGLILFHAGRFQEALEALGSSPVRDR
jgi:hypothetical protein